MKKFLFLLLFSFPAYAQMTDLMGSLSIQGALTAGDSQMVAQGMSRVKQTRILQDLQQTAMEIKTQYFGNYTSVRKDSLFGNPFQGVNWTVGSDQLNLFYIQLNQIDKNTCSFLLSSGMPTVRVDLNGQSGDKNCINSNQIKFVFD